MKKQEDKKNTFKKLKIAYIAPRFHPFKGGAEENMFAMASRSAKLGHDVTVLTTNIKFRNEKLPNKETYEGMKIIRHWTPSEALYLGFYPQLFTHLLKNEYDVIHATGIGFLWREFCLLISKKFKNKGTYYINTPHGPFMALGDTGGVRGISKKMYDKVLKMFLNKLYDLFIEVNPKQSNWIAKDYGIEKSKIILIPNGIDSNYIEKEPYQQKFEDDKLILSFIGRLERYKGPHQVVKAMGKLKRTRKNLHKIEFWILGRPSASGYKEYISKLVEKEELGDSVRFIFSPSDEERDDVLYKHSHVLLLPSKWEVTGIVLIEAMAKGNAIVTTNQNEAADLLITNEVNGYIYENEDINQLSKIIEQLASNRPLIQNMSELNIERARDLTWDKVYETYKQILEKV